MQNRIIIGITGASGAPLAVELLRRLEGKAERHVILSPCGELTLRHELNMAREDLLPLCEKLYDNDDYGAAPASGSYPVLGMVIVPCSMKTLAGVATGYCDSLLLRAADVQMKERRKLVLVPRECPFSTLHLRNMATASELGAVILPPVPAYYNHPRTIEDVNRQVAEKILAQFGLGAVPEWGGMA